MHNETVVIDTPEGIKQYRHLAMLSALKLEAKGMRMSRGISMTAMVKREFGFKGNRTSLIEQLEQHLNRSSN